MPLPGSRLTPPSGPRYELFDTSFYLAWIAIVGYIIFPLPSTTRAATGAPLYYVTETQLGYLVAATAVAGLVLSYSERHYQRGYIAARLGAFFMTINFGVTIVVLLLAVMHVVPAVPDMPGTARVALLYVMFYGWPTRRLKRDNGPEH